MTGTAKKEEVQGKEEWPGESVHGKLRGNILSP